MAWQRSTYICPNRLVLRITLQGFGTLFATVARHLETSKWRIGMVFVPRVEPDGASLDPIREAKGLAEIRSLNARSKTVRSIVCEPNSLLLASETDQGNDRTKDFFSWQRAFLCVCP